VLLRLEDQAADLAGIKLAKSTVRTRFITYELRRISWRICAPTATPSPPRTNSIKAKILTAWKHRTHQSTARQINEEIGELDAIMAQQVHAPAGETARLAKCRPRRTRTATGKRSPRPRRSRRRRRSLKEIHNDSVPLRQPGDSRLAAPIKRKAPTWQQQITAKTAVALFSRQAYWWMAAAS